MVDILWEDKSALVVNKPAGLLTQGAAGIETLETRLSTLLKTRDNHQGNPYIGLPHRIDRPVSGALLIAKNARAVRRFCAQFQSRKIGKTYWAIIAGKLESESATWIDTMAKVPDKPVARIVSPGDQDTALEGARRAVLHYRLLCEIMRPDGSPWSLVEIELETGRMHQIRLQFGSRGFPLLGDSLYGSSVAFGPKVEDDRQRWIALHAREIRFRHPKTGVETRVVAPPPKLASKPASDAANAEMINGWNWADQV